MELIDLNNQLRGMIYGFIVGDALGVPVEFKARGTFEVTDMIGYGTYNLHLELGQMIRRYCYVRWNI